MEKVVLKGTKRTVRGKQVGALRRTGKLPAVIYGRRTEPVSISLDAHEAGLALANDRQISRQLPMLYGSIAVKTCESSQ